MFFSNSFQLHIESSNEKTEESSKEVDFFEEHSTPVNNADENLDNMLNENNNMSMKGVISASASLSKDVVNDAPLSVNLTADPAQVQGERKSIIGSRKPAGKRTGVCSLCMSRGRKKYWFCEKH